MGYLFEALLEVIKFFLIKFLIGVLFGHRLSYFSASFSLMLLKGKITAPYDSYGLPGTIGQSDSIQFSTCTSLREVS